MTSGVLYEPLRHVKLNPSHQHELHISDLYLDHVMTKTRTEKKEAVYKVMLFSFDEFVRVCRTTSPSDAIEIDALSDFLRMFAAGMINIPVTYFQRQKKSTKEELIQKKSTKEELIQKKAEIEASIDDGVELGDEESQELEDVKAELNQFTSKERDEPAYLIKECTDMVNRIMMRIVCDFLAKIDVIETLGGALEKARRVDVLEREFNTLIFMHSMIMQTDDAQMLSGMTYENIHGVRGPLYVPRKNKIARAMQQFSKFFQLPLLSGTEDIPYIEITLATLANFKSDLERQLESLANPDTKNRSIVLFGMPNLLSPSITPSIPVQFVKGIWRVIKSVVVTPSIATKSVINPKRLAQNLYDGRYIPDIIATAKEELKQPSTLIGQNKDLLILKAYQTDLKKLINYVRYQREAEQGEAPTTVTQADAHLFFTRLFRGYYETSTPTDYFNADGQLKFLDKVSSSWLSLFKKDLPTKIRFCNVTVKDSSNNNKKIKAACVFMRAVDMVRITYPSIMAYEYPNNTRVANYYEETNISLLMHTDSGDSQRQERRDIINEYKNYMRTLMKDDDPNKEEQLSQIDAQFNAIYDDPKMSRFNPRSGRVAYQTDRMFFHTLNKMMLAQDYAPPTENPLIVDQEADWVGFLVFDMDPERNLSALSPNHRAYSIIQNDQHATIDPKKKSSEMELLNMNIVREKIMLECSLQLFGPAKNAPKRIWLTAIPDQFVRNISEFTAKYQSAGIQVLTEEAKRQRYFNWVPLINQFRSDPDVSIPTVTTDVALIRPLSNNGTYTAKFFEVVTKTPITDTKNNIYYEEYIFYHPTALTYGDIKDLNTLITAKLRTKKPTVVASPEKS